MSKRKNTKRYNITIAFVYIIGIILLVRLFQLQIVEGAEYREQSNTRLTRETEIKAARGNIRDSSGNRLVSTTIEYNVEIHKTKIDNDTLNNSLLLLAQTLETNGDKYSDTFPIVVNDGNLTFKDGVDLEKWKSANKVDSSYDVNQSFDFFKKRYGVNSDNIDDARKIVALRYYIEQNGYSNTKAVTLASNISNTSFAKINEMGASFPGINTYEQPKVYYPYGTLASHILGYVGPISQNELKDNPDYEMNDSIGKTGIEKVFEKYLKGKDGVKQIDMSVDGVVTDEYVTKEAIAGSDVVLTIDADLQKVTENALENNIKQMQAQGMSTTNSGAAVVVNVKTGEVLAMASYPNYDPSLFIDGISTENWNKYLNDASNPLLNKAISDKSAPGSTFKMVTAIAGLESGAIDVNTKINDTGRYTYFKDYQPYCWNKRGHGWLNVTQAIERSCNYFFYETGRRAGIDQIKRIADCFGLGQKTGIELPDEIKGTLSCRDVDSEWTGGKTIQSAIGQLYNDFTPLQMAKYTAMIANGGKNLDITIVKSIKNADGTEVSRNELNNYVTQKLGVAETSGSDLKISEVNLNAVREGMRGVTSDDGGTAYSIFKGFNIEVGGKTGSASTNQHGNANAWFVGFAPYNDPEIAVAVFVKNGQHGGSTAPVAKEIIAQYLGMNAVQITEDMSAKNEMQNVN